MCHYRLFGETFLEDGARLLGSVFALERLISLMPGYVFGFGSVKADSKTRDETVLLECLGLFQAGKEEHAQRKFVREFNLTMPSMLRDLFREISQGFQRYSLGFGVPETTQALQMIERPAVVH